MDKKSACEVLMTGSLFGVRLHKIGPHESRLGPNVMWERSAETKIIRARGEEDRTLWGDGPRERKRLGLRRADIESSHLHTIEKDPLRSTGPRASQIWSARGEQMSVWDRKQFTREAEWSACGDKGPHAKRICAEESTGVLENKNGPCVGLGPHIRGKGLSEGKGPHAADRGPRAINKTVHAQ